MGRMYIFLRMFSVLSIWKPYRSNWPQGSEPPTRMFPWGSEESENTKNEWFSSSSNFSFKFFCSPDDDIILDREDHEHAAGVVSEESFLLHDFLIDSLETSCISLHWDISMFVSSSSGVTSTSCTDHYLPLILVHTIFSCFLFFILFLPTGSIFYFPVHKLKSIYSSSSSSFFNLFF
jgi:hypothetical protein